MSFKSSFNAHCDPGPSHNPPPSTIDLSSLLKDNRSIKIIKPSDDIVSGGGVVFNSVMDDSSKRWLDNIQNSWNLWKKSPNTLNLLRRFFENVDNPYLHTLKLLMNYRGRIDCKNNTLSYVTVEELKNWSCDTKRESLELCNPNIKIAAFNIAKDRNNASFLKLVADTYSISEDDIICYVKDILQQKQYNSACHIIIAFRIVVDNIIDSLLFPLVLQDKGTLLDEYLLAFPDQALTLVEFLDSFLGNNYSFKDQLYNYMSVKKISVGQIKWDRIHYKTFGKLISRICNKHHISLSVCSNLTNQRAVGGLRYLIHQKYNNNISDSAWNDMVIDAINQNPHLIQELITLVDHYNTKDACKWAQYFNYSEELCPENMRLYMRLYMNRDDNEESISPTTSSQINNYHSLPGSVKTVFVNTPELFVEAVENVLTNELVIGIDSEWKPSFGTKKSTVSLIQISTRSAVYLFDALCLNQDHFTHLWTLLSKKVFENSNIIKLGFGIENDMREIKSSIPGLKLLKYKDFNFIEVQTLWKAVTQVGIKLPHKREGCGEGLSAIVQQCFGSSLKKHEQCSNWEIRPLRHSQIEYAALDAYVLLEIYNLFDILCQQMNLNIEDLCNRVRENAEKARMKKSKKKACEKYINCNKGPNDSHILSTNIKLLFESCLGALAKYLRCCGADVDIIQESETWAESVDKAAKENRFIVIKNFNSKKVSNQIPRNHVYVVESPSADEQFKEICSYFNINIQINSLFSRCDDCNVKDLTTVSQHTMLKLKSGSQNKLQESQNNLGFHSSSNNKVTFNERFDEDDDYDGFLSDNDVDDDLVLVVQDLSLSAENIDVNKCLTKFRVEIKSYNVPSEIINLNTEFHICQPCGKCFFKNGYFPENITTYIFQNFS